MSHFTPSEDGSHLHCLCGSCNVSKTIWDVLPIHNQMILEGVARTCPGCRTLTQERRSKLKLYSLDVSVYATAYVKAESPEQAIRKANLALAKSGWEFKGEITNEQPFDQLMNASSIHSEVTLSPAMTVDHIHGEPVQVWPE